MTGFRPSQDLSYSPLVHHPDNGAAWSPGPLDAALAERPGRPGRQPRQRRLLALLADGDAELSGPAATAWSTLATHQTLAASAGRHAVRAAGSLTAAAFSPVRAALARRALRPARDRRDLHRTPAGPGSPAGPALPAALCHQNVTVLRLTPTAQCHHGAAGGGHRASGTPASRLVHRRRRPLDPVTAAAAARRHADLGVVRARRHDRGHHHRRTTAQTITGRGRLLAAAAAAAPRHGDARPGPRRHGRRPGRPRRTLTIWQHVPGGATWTKVQVINVPIQYGSSS